MVKIEILKGTVMDSLQNLADVLASQARSASGNLRTLSENSRKAVLLRTAELLREKKSEIFEKMHRV